MKTSPTTFTVLASDIGEFFDLMERASFANAHPPVRFEPSAANPGAGLQSTCTNVAGIRG